MGNSSYSGFVYNNHCLMSQNASPTTSRPSSANSNTSTSSELLRLEESIQGLKENLQTEYTPIWETIRSNSPELKAKLVEKKKYLTGKEQKRENEELKNALKGMKIMQRDLMFTLRETKKLYRTRKKDAEDDDHQFDEVDTTPRKSLTSGILDSSSASPAIASLISVGEELSDAEDEENEDFSLLTVSHSGESGTRKRKPPLLSLLDLPEGIAMLSSRQQTESVLPSQRSHNERDEPFTPTTIGFARKLQHANKRSLESVQLSEAYRSPVVKSPHEKNKMTKRSPKNFSRSPSSHPAAESSGPAPVLLDTSDGKASPQSLERSPSNRVSVGSKRIGIGKAVAKRRPRPVTKSPLDFYVHKPLALERRRGE